MKTLTTIENLRLFLETLDKNNIKYMVIAGFALDGIRGRITRPHQDADVLCLKRDSDKIIKIADDWGYKGEWFNDLYKIKRKDGSKMDLGMATIEGNEAVTYGRIAITRFPLSFFDHPQMGKIEGFEFKIAPNELLKTFGMDAQKGEDSKFVESLKVNQEIMKRIKRTLR